MLSHDEVVEKIESPEMIFTEHEVGEVLRVSLATVRRWRRREIGPDFVKLGSSVRYKQEAVLSWLQSLPARGLARGASEK